MVFEPVWSSKVPFYYFLVVSGYGRTISEEKTSWTSIKYLDIGFRKSPSETLKIRITAVESNDHTSFQKFLTQKSPLRLKKLTQAKQDKSFLIRVLAAQLKSVKGHCPLRQQIKLIPKLRTLFLEIAQMLYFLFVCSTRGSCRWYP